MRHRSVQIMLAESQEAKKFLGELGADTRPETSISQKRKEPMPITANKTVRELAI